MTVPTVEVASPGTWRFRNAHLWCEQARLLMDRLGAEGVNLYQSAAGARSDWHAEPYDLIAVQLAGRKVWHLDQPLTLEQGEVLLLAAGTQHCTEALTASVHLTVRWPP